MICEKTGDIFNPDKEPGAIVTGVPFFYNGKLHARKIHLSKEAYGMLLDWLGY